MSRHKSKNKNKNKAIVDGTLGYKPRVEASELGALVFYRLTEHELETFCSGGDSGYKSEITSFLAGTFVAILIALFTTQMSDLMKGAFVSALIILFLVLIVLLYNVYKERSKVKKLYEDIKSRTRTKIG